MIHAIPVVWRKRGAVIGLVSILVIATLLRWPMVFFALPYTPHPDEPYVINMIFDMMYRHTWIPNNFDRPHLSVYVAYVAVWLGQWWHPIDPALLVIPTDRITQVSSAFVDARIAMLFTGIASIAAAYWHLTQRHFTWGAWLGALWLALLPWHQDQSVFITPDVMVGLCTFLIAGTCWHYATHPTTRQLWLVAGVIGLATGTKYNLGAAVIIPVIMQWPLIQQRQWRTVVRNGMILVLGMMLGLIVSTPGLIWSLNEIRANLDSQMSHYSRPDSNYTPWEWRYYLWFFQHEGWLWVGSIVACLGITLSLKQRRLVDIGLFCFFLFQLLFFMSRERHYMRNLMPIVVYGVVYIIIGSTWLVTALKRWIPRHNLRIALIAGGLLFQPIQMSIDHYQFNQRTYNPLRIDAFTAQYPRGSVRVCSDEPITKANTPSCDTSVLTLAEVTQWQTAGAQQLVVNRAQYADWQIGAPWQLAAHIPASNQGGNGDPFDIYRNTQAATVIGTPATTSDGVRIDGVRLGYGQLRNRITPLEPHATLTRRGDVLNVNIYFGVDAAVSEPGWWLFVHVLDATGQKVGERATVARSDYPIADWRIGEEVVVNADMPLDLPAGDYTLVIGFFRPQDGARMIISGSTDGSWQVPFQVRR